MMEDTRSLFQETLRFVLSGIERELRIEIDWRAAGRGRKVFRRAAIYAAAMLRDLVRIPTHHPDGVAQARFRVRIQYIEYTAVPTVKFFLDRYPLSRHQQDSLATALSEFEASIGLISDGKIRALDEWYATMEEFAELTERCGRAADAIAKVFSDSTEDFEFSKPRTVIRLFAIGTEFVSRSEAKRLVGGLEKFRVVVLDFEGIDLVGQGFADEVFRVWAREHPDVALIPTGMADAVAFMVERAIRGAGTHPPHQ